MLEAIWVPDWLYTNLPRASALTGMAGLTLLPPSILWMPVALACLAYGFAVMVARF